MFLLRQEGMARGCPRREVIAAIFMLLGLATYLYGFGYLPAFVL